MQQPPHDPAHKTILQVHNRYRYPGGEDTVVQNERELLRSHGHTVLVYERQNAEIDGFTPLQKLLLPVLTVFNPKTYRDIKHILRAQKVDVVHVHNTLNLISPAVYYAARACGVPVVQTVHNFRLLCPGATFYRDGQICEDCVQHGLGCAVRHACYRGSRAQTLLCVLSTWLHRATGIYNKLNYLCLTEFTRDKLVARYPKAQFYVKPNFVFAEPDPPPAPREKEFYLYVGRIEEIKGVDLLVDAFAALPDRKLKIAGSGVGEAALRARVEREGLHNVELLGQQSRAQLDELLRRAKAVVVTSQCYETFGMVIAEAYSRGVPVIVGEIGNLKTLVQDGKTGVLFRYDSPEALREAVQRFETLDRDQCAAAAVQYYRDNLTEQANYTRLCEIYDAVCGTPPKG